MYVLYNSVDNNASDLAVTKYLDVFSTKSQANKMFLLNMNAPVTAIF